MAGVSTIRRDILVLLHMCADALLPSAQGPLALYPRFGQARGSSNSGIHVLGFRDQEYSSETSIFVGAMRSDLRQRNLTVLRETIYGAFAYAVINGTSRG